LKFMQNEDDPETCRILGEMAREQEEAQAQA
jgi:hypothetical protein